MKRCICLFCILVVLAAITFVNCDGKNNPSEALVEPVSITKTIQEVMEQLYNAETEKEADSIFKRQPKDVLEELLSQCEAMNATDAEREPWSGPAVDAFLSFTGRGKNEIIAVQHMDILQDGIPIDTIDAVITNDDTWYYYNSDNDTLSTDMPASMAATTEMDVYGEYVEKVKDMYYCWDDEYVITFHLPVCFYYIDDKIGQFDGILDAWAPNPPCSWYCNGGICAFYQCGKAWEGAGNVGWWNFKTCGQDRPLWSTKVGKQVQKRWLHTWQYCQKRSNQDIAKSVRARIKF